MIVIIVLLTLILIWICIFTFKFKKLFSFEDNIKSFFTSFVDDYKNNIELRLDEISNMNKQYNENILNLKFELGQLSKKIDLFEGLIEKIPYISDSLNENIKELEHSVLISLKNEELNFQKLIQDNLDRIGNDNKESLLDVTSTLDNQLEKISEVTEKRFSSIDNIVSINLEKLGNQSNERLDKVIFVLDDKLDKIRSSNEEKLSIMNKSISDKLDISLNERLDKSFETIGNQLQSLSLRLGELSNLTDGVEDLNKTLSNVKKRGIWGEAQLDLILSDILTTDQYDKNVYMKRGSKENVEFAIKIPSKDDTGFIYLPIDSKFPNDIYEHIVSASDSLDKKRLDEARNELDMRIKQEARDIRDKYIVPPKTTDFAIMFIPTESLYCEILRIPNLASYCQKECKVIICSPTTLSAIINSLSVGFKYLTINKNQKEVVKVLSAVRKQCEILAVDINKSVNHISNVSSTTDKLKNRVKMIYDKLDKLEKTEITIENSDKLLGIEIEEDKIE